MSDTVRRNADDQNLYDLTADAYEQNDLASQAQQRDRMATLRAEVLDGWKSTGGSVPAVARC